jgi:hypothetical protein
MPSLRQCSFGQAHGLDRELERIYGVNKLGADAGMPRILSVLTCIDLC